MLSNHPQRLIRHFDITKVKMILPSAGPALTGCYYNHYCILLTFVPVNETDFLRNKRMKWGVEWGEPRLGGIEKGV